MRRKRRIIVNLKFCYIRNEKREEVFTVNIQQSAICKMILNKQWSIESPLRRFGINNASNKLTYSIINRVEKFHLPLIDFYI